MSVILHVDSSVRAITNSNPEHDSISKMLARQFINKLQQAANTDEYIYRDVGMNPPPLYYSGLDWRGIYA